MRPIRALIAMLAMLAGAPALAQPVTSAGPESVSVTIYRDPDRAPDTRPDLRQLRGYALVTERRTVRIPAGRAVIRFEGVAAGILPESAIVTGLPDGVREKNLDADLLSPRSLYGRSYGRPVTIRRTSKEGPVIEEPAIIRSGPDGAAILQTKDGFIAADCRYGKESLVYESVPAGLSPRPTLSIETDSTQAREVTLTLSYLAWGFDWQANYVANMRPDGRSADIFAWVTLASTDVTSFADAETMVVGGAVNREDSAGGRRPFRIDGAFYFQCFPRRVSEGPLPLPAPPSAMDYGDGDDEIVVTGMRASLASSVSPKVMVTTENLGDLKLFRVPGRTTVASNSQKQVALLDRQDVPVDIVYGTSAQSGYAGPVRITLRLQNRESRRLGVPLPAGGVALFAPFGGSPVLIGEGSIGDKAVDEEADIDVAEATQVTAAYSPAEARNGWENRLLTVTNANPFPVRFEAVVGDSRNGRPLRASARLGRKNGNYLWSVEVPANGTATLRLRN